MRRGRPISIVGERASGTTKHFPSFALTVDLANAFEWLNALERRVAHLEELTRTLTAVRGDLASIADGTDPALAQRLADLSSTLENHGLLLAQLLDQRTQLIATTALPPLGLRVGGGCACRGGDCPAPAVVTVSRWRLRR
jgi:hypothetical protein